MSANIEITSRTPIGFIGLGYLGSRIARRLADAGFRMTVYDRDSGKANGFSNLGVGVAPNLGMLARNVEVLMSCLPDGGAVEDVYFRTGKVLESVGTFTKIIELSTVAPETSQRLHQAGQELSIPVLDVAVSGSTRAAESGALTLFAGGERADYEVAQSLFAAIASQWFYMGPSGSGTAMKLVTLLGLGMQAIAESLALGRALGLPRELLFDTLSKTAVVAPAHVGKLATAKMGDYAPQFPLRLMRKDFGLILNEAARTGLSMPATESAAISFDETASAHEEDFSAVVRQMEEQLETRSILPPAA
jgi:3-hydroxyisobutyrate dehydrogenase-like beta-hydroxyacid dehydrogenase